MKKILGIVAGIVGGDNRIVPHTAYGISSLLVGHYQYDMRMFLCVCKRGAHSGCDSQCVFQVD